VPQLLAAGADGGRATAERLPARAGADALRAPARVPRQRWKVRPDRRVLRPSRRVAVVRPQRGRRPALLLPRLEIRRDRPLRRCSLGAAGERLLPEDQAEILPAGAARPGAV